MSTVVREREFSQQHARFSEKKRVSLPKSSGLSSGPSDLPKSSGLYTGVNTPFSQLSIDQRQTLFVAPLMAVTAAARAATANLSTPTASMGAASTTSIATTSTAAVAIATTAATAATLATAATATEKVNNGTMYFPLPSFPLPLLPPPVVTSAPRGQFPTDVKTPVANAPPSNRQIECMCCQLEQSAKETPSAIMRVALPFDRCYLHAYVCISLHLCSLSSFKWPVLLLRVFCLQLSLAKPKFGSRFPTYTLPHANFECPQTTSHFWYAILSRSRVASFT